MKTILILSSEFPPLPGGLGNHAFLLSKFLRKEGYKVTVISDFRSCIDDTAFDNNQDFKIIRIKRNILTYLNRFLHAIKYSFNNEVIICSGKFSLWMGGTLTLLFSKKKIIGILHGTELNAGGFFSRFLTKWSVKKMDQLIAVSHFTKQKAFDIDHELNIVVINNGIELKYNTILSKQDFRQINLVTVGNLTSRKGQQNVIKSLPLLISKYPNLHYHCIGIPTELQSFTQLANELNVLNNITFHGALSDDKKNVILANSTIFCMLSNVLKNGDVEGFGIALLEANQIGIPTIGSNNSGIVDAISHKYSGLLIDPTNPTQFLEAINEILSHFETYSENAILWAKKFDWDIVIQEYTKVIES